MSEKHKTKDILSLARNLVKKLQKLVHNKHQDWAAESLYLESFLFVMFIYINIIE